MINYKRALKLYNDYHSQTRAEVSELLDVIAVPLSGLKAPLPNILQGTEQFPETSAALQVSKDQPINDDAAH